MTSLDSSQLNKWEWFKFKVKEAAIKIGKYYSKQMRLKQREIVASINILCSKLCCLVRKKAKLENLKNQLDNLFLDKARGAFVRSRARWIEEGETILLTFLILRNKGKRKIQFLN